MCRYGCYSPDCVLVMIPLPLDVCCFVIIKSNVSAKDYWTATLH